MNENEEKGDEKEMKLDLERKTKAIGEVFLGMGTLEVIGLKYEISPSYLSTLASRAKRAMLRKGLSGDEVDMLDQSEKVNQLSAVIKKKVRELHDVNVRITMIKTELEKHIG